MVEIVQNSVRVISQTLSHVTRNMELVTAKRDGTVLIVQKPFSGVLTQPSVVQTLNARRGTSHTYVIATLDIKRMLLGLVPVGACTILFTSKHYIAIQILNVVHANIF